MRSRVSADPRVHCQTRPRACLSNDAPRPWLLSQPHAAYCRSMSTDIAHFLRLRGAIEAAVDAVPKDHAATAVSGLVNAYSVLRDEVRGAIDSTFHDEFDRLFPSLTVPRRSGIGSGFDPLASADAANEARTRLKMMGGWLSGFVEAAQLED